MIIVNPPFVIAADRIDGNVVIEFQDGMCGVFTSELLYSMLASAQPAPKVAGEVADGSQWVRSDSNSERKRSEGREMEA